MQKEILTSGKRKATIPQSFLEYKAEYKRPCFDAWVPQNKLLAPLYEILNPWGLQLRNITVSTGNNLEETNVTFGLPNIGIGLQIAIGSFKITAVNPDWSQANRMIELLNGVKGTVTKSADAEVSAQHTVHALHVKGDGLGQKEAVLGAVEFKANLGDDVVALGGGIYRRTSSIVFDKSAIFPDAVFVRLERQYPAEVTINNIAESVLKDEIEALDMLGLDVEGL